MSQINFSKLKEKLKGKVLIVGIGNPLKGDDGAGPRLIEKLRSLKTGYSLIDSGSAPENYLSRIVAEKPDTILFVDAVEFDGPAGYLKVLAPQDIMDTSLSTHNASLRLSIRYLEEETSANIILLGIQPKSVLFGENISKEVTDSIDRAVKLLVSHENKSKDNT